MDPRDHTAVDMRVTLADGREVCLGLDHAQGFPDNPLSDDMHVARFMDCLAYVHRPHSPKKGRQLIGMIEGIDSSQDVRTLIDAINQ